MSTTTPSIEPETLTIGYSSSWKITLANYSSTAYTLKYVLTPQREQQDTRNIIEITSTASGSAHLVTLLPVTTQNYKEGVYDYTAYVIDIATSGATTKLVVGSGCIEIKPDPLTDHSDRRTANQIILDNITEAIKKLSTGSISSASVNGKTFTKADIGELIKAQSFYRGQVRNEKAAQQIAKGLGNPNNIKVRFVHPR
jgi:hypothetical protein